MLKPNTTYPIEDVWIDLTFPDDQQEKFQLEAPNGGDPFRFRFVKIAKLEDYRDAQNNIQRGCYFYQLQLTYDYEAHNMDLKKLLIASNIRLRFPPAFGQKHNYNVADVLLANDETVKNYLQGLAIGSDAGEIVPSGSITLEFEGVDSFSEFQILALFGWNQSDNADDDGDDTEPPTIAEDVDADVFIIGGGGAGGFTSNNPSGRPHTGGGGGSGGVLFLKSIVITAGTLNFQIGKGGRKWEQIYGQDSFINDFIALGGGRGGYSSTTGDSDGGAGGGARHFFQSTGGIPGDGTAGQGTSGQDSPGGGFPALGGRGGSCDNVYNGNFDPILDGSNNLVLRGFLNGDGLDFRTVFGPYFASKYGWDDPDDPGVTNAYFGGGGGGGVIDDDGTNADHNNGGKGGGGDGGYVLQPWDDIPILGEDGNDGTGAGGGGTVGYNATTSASGGNGFAMFRVPIAQAHKVQGDYIDVFDFDGYRHYVLSDANGETPPPPTDRPFLYSLNVYPKIGSAPHTVTVEVGVVNRTGVETQLDVNLDGSQAYTFVVPANGTFSNAIEWTHADIGTYVWTLGDQTQTVYVDTDRPPGAGNYEGSIEILSDADSNFLGTKATGTIEVIGSPTRQSDPCDGDGEKFRIRFEGVWYCMTLPAGSKNIIASAVSGQISSDVPNLGSSAGELSFVGNPLIRVTYESIGSEHNGKTVTFSVNSGLESDGGVFNKLDVYLLDGQDPAIIDDPVDILIGGTVFATTENIVGDETQASIATKIYQACNAVYSEHLSFEKIGDKIRIISSLEENLTVDLNIRNAGFDFVTQNIVES